LELENKKKLENKKTEYQLKDCYGNDNGNGNIQSHSLYTRVPQVQRCSGTSNDKISANGIERKKLGEIAKCKFCHCEGIIVEKFHRLPYSTKTSYA
jgi:hypothetical protein